MAKDAFWQDHRINPQTPTPAKPGVLKRQAQEAAATDLFSAASSTKNLQNVDRARQAAIRVERVARDEPAIEGSDKPSVIRQRANKPGGAGGSY